ncbi:MAG TPA: DUF58 domain-containing protein [Candidatus Limnocylindrales bacterium]|nr:DUF58 domain-containing protein [Candidatus Limnocylindrales bacterium]
MPAQPRTKAAPGPGPTPEALLRALDVTVGRRIHGLIPGEYRAHDRGGGTELAQIRPYEPGDDVRRIDWNVTARTTVPHVRIHVPERALTCWLLLDVSPSMTFGTADRRKADVAEGVALAVGHLTTQRGNRLGVATFGGSREVRLQPAGGRQGLLAALVTARSQTSAPAPAPTGAITPADALRFVGHAAPRGGLVVVVSDFRGPRDWATAMAGVTSRATVIAVEIRDPREDELTDVGTLTLIDGETGREIRVETSSRSLRENFARAAAEERADLARELRRLGARHVVLSTSGDWLRSLAGQLRTIRRAS